jgi:hypothetical protein
MASWLSRATEAFRRPPPPEPEPFNVRCDCGGFVTGERLPAAQRPGCPDCGRPVFVLPANVYPVPVRSKKKGTKQEAAATPGEGKRATREEPSVEEGDPGVKPSAGPPGGKPPAKPDRRTVANGAPAKAAASQPVVSRPEGILLESRTRILTPFRLIVAAIVVMGSLTGWGLWHRHQVESAKIHVLAAHEAGMKALKEGNFAVAARELRRARDAVDLLRRTDADANSIRRYCREAVAGDGLLDSSLFEVLAEFAADPANGKGRFASRHRNSWLVLDAVIANPEATDRPCVLDMPLLMDGMKFRIEVDSPAIRTAARREFERGAARVIFAAPMSEIRPPSAEDPGAVLVLDGKSAFLWTTLETYTALGYAEDRDEELQLTRDLLARQLEQGGTSQ